MSSGIPSGLPVTYIADPGTPGAGTTVVTDGTVAVRNTGAPFVVQVSGGTISTTISFAGSISTDIGNVKIEDAADNYAVMPPAQDAKTAATTALVVQQLDPTGATFFQATQVAVMNNQGTLATSTGQASALTAQQTGNATATAIMNNQGTQSTTALALETTQTTGNAVLTAIHNSQGTQSTQTVETLLGKIYNAGTAATSSGVAAVFNSMGTLATSAAQATGNAAVTVVLNNQGTLATSANQVLVQTVGSISNDLLRQLVTASGTIPPAESVLLNAVTSPGASASVNVLWADQMTVQHIISAGSAVLDLRTSLDGINWDTEITSTHSELVSLEGRVKFVSVNYVTGNATVTTRMAVASSGGGGGVVSSSGTTNQFGAFSGALSQTIGSTYEINVDGYNGVGFHLVPPTGGQIVFEGSFDGVNWTAITVREIGANGYTQKSSVVEDYIGSVACLTKIRFRTSVGGSAPGSVGGRMTVPSNTLEGIEHGNPPHLIGYPCVVKSIFCSGSAYNTPVWVPAAGKKAVITDVHLSVDATAVITLSDGAVSLNDWIIYSSVKVTAGDSKIISENFRTPHVSHQSGGTVYITQTAGSVTGVLHGYEIDV